MVLLLTRDLLPAKSGPRKNATAGNPGLDNHSEISGQSSIGSHDQRAVWAGRGQFVAVDARGT
jgi:hypothetical protein